MRQDRKIGLPKYKIACAVCFTVLLALVRGVWSNSEIVATLEYYMPVLAVFFCGDLYEGEFREKRWEVFCLLPWKSQVRAVRWRFFYATAFLSLLSYGGYWLFYWQFFFQGWPAGEGETKWVWYGICLFSVTVCLFFWGLLAFWLTNLLCNLWAGMGLSLCLWFFLISKKGEELLGSWNPMVVPEKEQIGDWSWLLGKGAGIVIGILLFLAIPWAMKRRKKK